MPSTLESAPVTTALEPLPRRAARGGMLVLGGGFAGAYVARRLGRAGATIVNPTNFMLYTPLLPEAAAGNIEPRHVSVPLRTMCPHADLLLGRAVSLDHEGRVVEVHPRRATSRHLRASSWSRSAPSPACRPSPASRARPRPQGPRRRDPPAQPRPAPDRACRRRAPRPPQRRLTFVVRGRRLRRRRGDRRAPGADRGGAPPAPAPGRRQAALGAGRRARPHPRPDARRARALRRADAARRGVEIVTQTRARLGRPRRRRAVRRASHRDRHRRVDGRRGREPAGAALGLPVDDHGRVEVDETLRVVGAEDVWSLGDCAAVPNLATPGVVDPPTCQHALRQARRLSKNLRGNAEALQVPLAGPHGDARPPPRHRGRGRPAPARDRGLDLRPRLPRDAAPFAARRARVVADWTSAALFRRDLAELSMPATAELGA